MGIKTKAGHTGFQGEGQIYSWFPTPDEPIPDYHAILEQAIDQNVVNKVLNSGGIKKAPRGDQGAITGISLGGGPNYGGGILEQVPGVFEVLQRSTRVPGKVLKRPTNKAKDFLSKVVFTGNGVRLKTTNKGGTIVPKVKLPPNLVRSSPPTAVGGLPGFKLVDQDKKMALDLGSLLGNVISEYGQYQTAKLQQTPVFNPLSSLADVFGSEPETVTGIPKGYHLDCNGNLVKKSRRRRRRLATPSDIKDLAALSAVTTPAEKKTWIATHPS